MEEKYRPLAAQFEKKTYTDGTHTLLYRVRMPDPSIEKAPVVLFLHGAGERGCDNEKQLDIAILNTFSLCEEMQRSIVIAPQCPEGERWANYSLSEAACPVDETPETYLLRLTAEVVARYAALPCADKDRVYVTGLSMGGFGTWDILARHGGLFAAGVPICGGGDPAKAALLAGIPIYAFHGAKDDVVPPIGTERMARAIEKEGKGKLHCVIFGDSWHDVWDRALAYTGSETDPPTLKWMFEQRK